MKSFAVRYLGVLGIVSLATFLMMARFDFPLTGIDDANIFFVYAKNFANGHGFVYNVGGERVEGFSSLLWTLLCTVVFSLSTSPELPLLIINIIIISLGITAALAYIRSALVPQMDSRYAGWLWPPVFLVLLVTSPAYIIWNTIALMENAVWSTLLLLATVFVIQENISSRAINVVFIPISILMMLTRPESFLWVGVLTATLLVRKTQTDGITRALREMIAIFVAIVATVIILTVFRLSYFGYPLPNTYYAKVSPSLSYNFFQGILYLVKYFVSNPIVSVCILATILAGVHTILKLWEKKLKDDGRLFLPLLAGIGLLVPMITGGDHFSSFRFYQGVYPIVLLCLLYFVISVLPQYIQLQLNPNIVRWPQRIFIYSLALVFASSLVLYQARDWIASEETSGMSNAFVIAQKGREEGEFIREMFNTLPELPSIGVVRAGGIKYTYPGEVIDLMGLNNLLMAHNGGKRLGEKNHAAFEKSTFYQLQPDLLSAEIVSTRNWQYKEMDLKKSWDNTVPLKGLYDDPDFLERYRYAKIYSTGTGERALVAWFRNDFLHDLESGGAFVIERYEYGNE
jgi:arabinofuranosyltransferase